MSSEEKVKGNNTGRIITIIVGAILVSTLTFFIYKYLNEKNKNEQVELTNDEMTAEIEDLEKDIEDFKLDLENQDLDLEEKERLLIEKEQSVEEKQKKIDQLLRQNKISKAAAERLKGKVEQLEFYIKRYQMEIDDLKEQVAELSEANDSLKGQVSNMSNRVHNLTRESEDKDFIIEVAKVLTAMNFSSYYIRNNGKRIPDNPIRKGRMAHIEICFNLVQNTAAKVGEREVFMQIVGPKGNVVRNGGGYVSVDGQDEAYTVKKTINYDRTTQQVCMKFKKSDEYEYEKGDHVVNIYCEGFNIGSGSFNVR